MKNKIFFLLLLLIVLAALPPTSLAQDARTLLNSVEKALGGENLNTLHSWS